MIFVFFLYIAFEMRCTQRKDIDIQKWLIGDNFFVAFRTYSENSSTSEENALA